MTNDPPASPQPETRLPIVVQVGFGGARRLYDLDEHAGIDAAAFEAAVEAQFAHILSQEIVARAPGPGYFLCGISQIAVGGDTVFTRACRAAGLVQRVFLPQPREDYLGAVGSGGPDFTLAERDVARALLASAHVVQERVVSNAADRQDRFHDVNLEIVRVSDIVVGLVRAARQGRRGGTHDLLGLAEKHRRPLLEIEIEMKGSQPVLTVARNTLAGFVPPALPRPIVAAALPAGTDGALLPLSTYVRSLKEVASSQAEWHQTLFRGAAMIILGAHVAATIIAVVALKLESQVIPWLLGGELLLLAGGFLVHHYLHRTHRVERWAIARLAAEVARSVDGIGAFPVYLGHLFMLPFPPAFRPLLRTISVLHQIATHGNTGQPWQPMRDDYVRRRLVDGGGKAQLRYYRSKRDVARRWLTIARRVFVGASLLAIVATTGKLLVLCGCIFTHESAVGATLGALAVVLPVAAVAALSLAAAHDLEGRFHTYSEVLDFLGAQKTLLEQASSERDYERLLIETESRLLGETVSWYARRAFLGVA